jgi:cell wall-associated NlpC family hydrolase
VNFNFSQINSYKLFQRYLKIFPFNLPLPELKTESYELLLVRYKYTIVKFSFLIVIFFSISCYSSSRFKADNQTAKDKTDNNARYLSSNSNLDAFVADWLGTPYKYGGLSRNGVDCSGFAYLLMLHVYNKKIPRTSKNQYYKGRKINRARLMKGDLLFFRGTRGRGIDHVGIYLANDRFVHASSKEGVIISSLSEEYYEKRYVGACRY